MGNEISKKVASYKHSSDVDLSRAGIKVLTPDFKKLGMNCVTLNLSYNNLMEIPVGLLVKFSKLRALDISHNGINQFPLELPKTIESINASHNRLFYSPITPSIADLACLLYLDISSNQLEEIPDELFDMRFLKQLKLADNMLKVIPEKLYSMRELELLDVSGNQLSQISNSIGNMKSLLVSPANYKFCTILKSCIYVNLINANLLYRRPNDPLRYWSLASITSQSSLKH